MLPQARRYGYSESPDEPLDGIWQREWRAMRAGEPLLPGTDGSAPSPNFADVRAWEAERNSDTHIFPKPHYDIRWSQTDRPYPPPGIDIAGVPRRGAWRGFFGPNVSKTRMINTYNPYDQVLRIDEGAIDADPSRLAISSVVAALPGLLLPTVIVAEPLSFYAWYACQRIQKPRIAYVPGLWSAFSRLDNRAQRFWATLGIDTRAGEYLWGPAGNHSNITRQWAELAFWFPSLSQAAGTADLSASGIESLSFADIGGLPNESVLGGLSHSYMTDKPLHEVWAGHRRLRAILASQSTSVAE